MNRFELDALEAVELARLRSTAYPCSYLPAEQATLEFRVMLGLTAPVFEHMLARGWRHFGQQYFRPVCAACSKCISLRVDVAAFEPSRSQRRARKANAGLTVTVQPPTVTEAHIDLYNRYHADMATRRGWRGEATTPEQYIESFLEGDADFLREFLFHEHGRLVGVAISDVLPHSASSAYFFHDPSLRARALGVNAILEQIEYARAHDLHHQYLGYWVEGCASMEYKTQFRPHEILQGWPDDDEEPVWVPGS